MTENDIKAWLEELIRRDVPVYIERRQTLSGSPTGIQRVQREPAAKWYADGHSALARLLAPGDPLLTHWSRVTGELDRGGHFVTYASIFEAARGVLRSAHHLVEAGRLRSIVDGARLDTIAEVLDQAEELASAAPVAAAVLCGGALETHLRHLCERHGVTWGGPGSIEVYNAAIGKAIKDGVCTTLWSKTTTKQITTWGGMRNKAAHEPVEFAKECDARAVKRMIEGVRDFLAKWP